MEIWGTAATAGARTLFKLVTTGVLTAQPNMCGVQCSTMDVLIRPWDQCGVVPRYHMVHKKYLNFDSCQFHSLIPLGILCSGLEPF